MIKINLGCGAKRLEGYINVDLLQYGQEVQADVRDYMEQQAETNPETADEIRADHLLEHLNHDEVIRILNNGYRTLKPGGIFRIEVPSIHRPEAYYLVHTTLYSLETFTMLSSEEHCKPYGIQHWASVSGGINNRGNINVILTK